MHRLIPLVAVAALGASAYGLVELLEIGTCASGGPYVSARECPEGTGTAALFLAGGITVYTLSIIAASFRSFGSGMFWFGLLFTVLGGTFLYAEAADRVTGGGGVGWFVGGMFLLMGLPPLYGGVRAMLEPEDDTATATPGALTGLAAQLQMSANAAAQAQAQAQAQAARPPEEPRP